MHCRGRSTGGSGPDSVPSASDLPGQFQAIIQGLQTPGSIERSILVAIATGVASTVVVSRLREGS